MPSPQTPPALRLRDDRVYRVRSPQDSTVLLALRPHLHGAELRWHDTLRGRAKRGRLVVNEAERVVFETPDGITYTFEPLTLPLYEREVRARLEGQPVFPDEAALHRFLLDRFCPSPPAAP